MAVQLRDAVVERFPEVRAYSAAHYTTHCTHTWSVYLHRSYMDCAIEYCWRMSFLHILSWLRRIGSSADATMPLGFIHPSIHPSTHPSIQTTMDWPLTDRQTD
jgi:hypothetical protein